ncbi:hypothetical protein MMC25_008199 [Agyrium rufum]|nr:hypothetical protein [Agyrium rufum]
MSGLVPATVILAMLFTFIDAIHLGRPNGGASVMRMDFTKMTAARSDLRSRQIETTISNSLGVKYYANVSIGSPPQAQIFEIDTGSSDLFVNSANSSLCQSALVNCQNGDFNQSASSTFVPLNESFSISYKDGTGANGLYGTDLLQIGESSLTGFQFSLGQDSSSATNYWGLGYATNEAVVKAGGPKYNNTPLAMVQQALIKTAAYSLWLDDINSSQGSILFGGVDTSKYAGSLVSVPVQPNPQTNIINTFSIELNEIVHTTDGSSTPPVGTDNLPVSLPLVTSEPDSVFPAGLANDIYTLLGITNDAQYGAVCECSMGNSSSSSLDLTFSASVTISVPFSSLCHSPGVAGDQSLCTFGIGIGSSPTSVLLGDSFLRAAYVVFDLDNNEISLAQANYNSNSSSNILEILPGATGVPGAVNNTFGSNSSSSSQSSSSSRRARRTFKL